MHGTATLKCKTAKDGVLRASCLSGNDRNRDLAVNLINLLQKMTKGKVSEFNKKITDTPEKE